MKTNEKDTQQGVVPALRFPEFQNSAPWQIDTVENLVSTITPPCKLNTPEYQKSGIYPIVDQSQDLYCGWTNNQSAVIFQQFPLIIFGDHTCIIKLITQPFAQGADGVKILKSNKLIDPSFLYQCLGYKPIIQESYKRHFASLRNKIIAYPLKETGEQQKIADCLASIDALIKAAENKIDELKAHKKGLMQQLFPAEGKTVPALRFPEFQKAGEWTIIALNKLASRIIKKNNGHICRVLTNSAADGVVDQTDYFDRNIVSEKNLHNYYVIENGDYVYNPRISTSAPVGPISKNYIGQGVMSPLYTIFRFHNSNNEFYNQYFKTKYWHKYLKNVANQGARFDRMNITTDDFMNMPTPAPCQKEQQKIADCLSSADDLIAAQTNRLEALRNHKKGLMQQLFPNLDDTYKWNR